MWGIIATWRMAKEGVEEGVKVLRDKGTAGSAIEVAIQEVENYPLYKSVGFGGLPNEEMELELDAAYMDGDTLSVGAIAAIKDYANPISIAKKLSEETVNNMLVSSGAEKYAAQEGFERKNMLTKRAQAFYRERKSQIEPVELKPYDGHDTVGMVTLDDKGKVVAATSTSGLFMKRKGRVGDSPLVGSGFYADSKVGGATATGLGEDLMKGCISYEIVRLMKEGLHPQEACEKAVYNLDKELRERRNNAGDLSVVALNNAGEWGAATNIEEFSCVVQIENQPCEVYVIRNDNGKTIKEIATDEWVEKYMKSEIGYVDEEKWGKQ
ncbi:N(4)-(beta-N-acetylglucosaminyl)-L-asparaginase [Anaerorhabdus sp.]|uniref:N(4)-(beta-N-acetylglucosaminyl)-L-asparaginase n=1 Tax=Anaerorhabdus sp. TaxID=1872524 RepID=UPI002FCC62D1